MTPPNQVLQLIERFERNLAHYKQSGYKETEVRVEFIDPFFEALGWDIHNRQGRGELDKDVVHEDAIRVGGKTLAPDYSFRVGRARKFFLEAKKPAVSLKGDVGPAYQLRRYSWSVKLPLGVLTDFEEFAVYDCRQRPKPGDKAAVGRLMYITFDQYRERWNEIYEIFAKESVQQGSFDAYAQQTKTKRGSSEVDAELLKEIEGWRDVLARNIALRNGALSVYELNFCVQRTIDRIIFLRMCEDRGIEEYGQLLALTNGPHVYARLGEYYRRADEKYNAGLFDFTADTLTRSLLIDDKALKPILSSLYYPQCPYEFSVLPVEILGQVYEQFLGKVIRLTAGHRAKVEEKPEVKKAGGVYYTPSYIVDYIVSQTVGKLVQGKTPRQISKLRVLDPACGSGSFLLGAYQYLLDYHRQWYEDNDPAKHARRKQPAVYQASGGDWRLTGAEKKRILLNNIYGVDIDRQAVEVTKLSLLLQVLEGETEETLGQQLSLWRERALPDLGENIKCGNSLIGPDYFEAQLMPDEEEMRRVNPFDWESGFPEVMAAGGPSAGSGQGFDCVIGNPPYVRIQTMKEWAPTEVEFYKQQYAAASKGNYDIYVVFVERALQLLNERGRMGYILPHKFFQAKYGQPLRQLLAEGKHLAEVVHFGDQQVFTGASTYTCLLFLDKKGNQQFHYAKAHDLDAWRAAQTSEVSEDLGGLEGEIRADKVTEKEWNFVVGPGAPLFERLSEMPVKLGDVAHIFVGTQTSADKIFVLESCNSDGDFVVGTCKVTGEEVRVEANIVKPFLRGKDIRRYEPLEAIAFLICPYVIGKDKFQLMSEMELSSEYPLAYSYLKTHKTQLAARERGRFKGANWFAFGYPKSMILFQRPKIVVPDYNNVASFTLDDGGHFYKTGYGILLLDGITESPLYVLGLLNTSLLFQYLLQVGTTLRGGYVRFWTQFIERLPIRTINFDDPADVARHDKMVGLVERMLALHQKLSAAALPPDKQLYQRQIEATDRQIDALVYELYGLSEEEIGIVEGG
ncbi:MAG: restriction endonuclease subunit M [Chloroflexi bacterium]|nr:MAG: restriction endonuclease subunit M [Chloroflexota bacterium]RLC84878.1 MAG: restriction endonuclease subunit M [Chloroflexota bacterium]